MYDFNLMQTITKVKYAGKTWTRTQEQQDVRWVCDDGVKEYQYEPRAGYWTYKKVWMTTTPKVEELYQRAIHGN
jgi:hypothetical protein